MSNVRIVLNRPAVRELLKSPEMFANLLVRAERIKHAAGDGMEIETHRGPNRWRVTVRTATPAAMVREATTRDLTRAIDAGRG